MRVPMGGRFPVRGWLSRPGALVAVATILTMIVIAGPSHRAKAAPAPNPVVDVLNYELAANRNVPEVCFHLSQTIIRQAESPLESFVLTEPSVKLSARPRNNALCLTGFGFGVTYAVTLKAGLPGVSGTLAKDASFHIQIPDRPPELGFVSPTAEILPRLGSNGTAGAGLPLRSVNVAAIDVAVFRIPDRDMLPWRSRPALTGDMLAAFAPNDGEFIWRGAIQPTGEANRDVVTFLPIDKTLGPLKPGLYVAAAWPANDPAPSGKQRLATQYFTVSDLGLSVYRGAHSLVASARSLATAAAAQGVDIALIAANNRELGRVRTDENGLARFDGNLLLGLGEDSPMALYAYGAAGEFGVLSVDPAAFAAGLPRPARVAVAIATDRAAYRAGDAVNLSVLMRNQAGAAAPNQQLQVSIYRPNGALFDRLVPEDRGGGGYAAEFRLPLIGAAGRWRLDASLEGAAAPMTGPVAGSAEFDVEGPETEAMTISLTAEAAVLDPAQPGAIAVQTQYPDGQAAAGAPGEARVSVEPAVNPFPAFPDFSFGLEDETDAPTMFDPIRFSTDAGGKASIALKFGALPMMTKPLDARIAVRVLDAGGHPVEATMTAPVATQSLLLGIKAAQMGSFAENQAAHFEVIALSRDGARQEVPALGWEILRRDFAPSWVWDGTRYDYKASIDDTHVAGGTVAIPLDSAGAIDASLPAGRYRIEVFDPKGEAISSLYFSVGWSPSNAGPSQSGIGADSVELTPAKSPFTPGDGADIFVKPPYDSDVTLVTSDTDIRGAIVQHVPAAGATIHIDTPRDARTGLELTASAVAPPAAAGLSRRALGATPFPADPTPRRLGVKLDMPEKAVPGQTVTIPISVAGGGDEPVFVRIVAKGGETAGLIDKDNRAVTDVVDESIPSLGVNDVYGRIITPSGLSDGPPVAAKAEMDEPSAAPPLKVASVSASSAIVALDKGGKGGVSVKLPDFTGKLSIQALAWSPAKIGWARAELPVHYPLSTELRLPDFLAPDDRADLTLAVANMDGPRGEYRVKLKAEGGVALQDDSEIVLNLAEHEQRFIPIAVLGRAMGAGAIVIAVKGPAGIASERRLAVPVRIDVPSTTRRAMIALKPRGTLTLDPALTQGLRPETLMLSAAASAAGAFDSPGLARELRQADYPSAERMVDALTAALTPSSPPIPGPTIRRVLDFQGVDGGFSLWGAGASDPWLSAYAADLLTRAKNLGAAIPEAPFARALDYLARLSAFEPAPASADSAPPAPAMLENAAYAAKVLAMNKRLDLPRLRYFSERVMPLIHTPVTVALLAASFAALDDKAAAAGLFAQAQALPSAAAPDGYGSDLRDHAMLAALMAESAAAAQPSIQAALGRVVADAAPRRQFSAQEAAWIIRAQSAAPGESGGVSLKIGDKAVQQTGIVDISGKPGEAALPAIRNQSDAPVRLALTVSGVPTPSDGKDQSGYEIQRAFFDTAGKPVDPMMLRRNDILIVVLTGRYSGQGEGRPVIVDPLPAGWDMEAATIVDPAARYPWLKDLSGASAAFLDNGAYIAAPVMTGERHEFKIAYVVRAATQGQFAMPGSLVEDMVQPGLSARAAAGRIKIDAAQ